MRAPQEDGVLWWLDIHVHARAEGREGMWMNFPSKRYKVILADPPWGYECKSPTGSPRPESCQQAGGASYYYEVMSKEEICKIPVSEIAEKDSVLFLWGTVPLLPDAFEVMKAWGFEYKTMITWHKLRCKGMGYWFRGHTEQLLLGVRGNIRAFRSLTPNIQSIKVTEHSRKPPEFRNIIEDVTVGLEPKIELFAREKREGWDAWGYQVPKHCQKLLAHEAEP